MNKILTSVATICMISAGALNPADMQARTESTLTHGWQFAKVDSLGNRDAWQDVRVPHDWAIHEPFDRVHDLQVVAVEQNGETEKTEKTGRTGGLPYICLLYTSPSPRD